MTDLAPGVVEAVNRMLAVFEAMTDKVMSGRVTWTNIQTELTDDELAVFWACLDMRDAADRLGEALG